MQHPKKEQFINATPAGRLRILADEIENDREHHFDMSHSTTCAYGFAVRIVGEEITQAHTMQFANILGVPEYVASGIYQRTGHNRESTAHYLRILASSAEVQRELASA